MASIQERETVQRTGPKKVDISVRKELILLKVDSGRGASFWPCGSRRVRWVGEQTFKGETFRHVFVLLQIH